MAAASTRPRRRYPIVPVSALFVLAYALLFASWICANPPPSAPDEPDHYFRAVSIGHGQLVGAAGGRAGALASVGTTPPAGMSPSGYADALRWVGQNSRRVHIPAGLSPGWCPTANAYESARCLNGLVPPPQPGDYY